MLKIFNLENGFLWASVFLFFACLVGTFIFDNFFILAVPFALVGLVLLLQDVRLSFYLMLFFIPFSFNIGDVLDFGGNEGELNQFVKGNYTIVNYDHSPMEGKEFDTIVLLAVIEHIEVSEVYLIFDKFSKHLKKGGKILLTTPTPKSKWILELLAWLE